MFFVDRAVVAAVFFAGLSFGQNYCDDAYGIHCPDESGWGVGDCLGKLDYEVLGEKCSDFIALHNNCKHDIEKVCNGHEYTGDLLPCLTEWTSPDQISDGCKKLFPVKPPLPEKRKKTKKEKERDKKRKKIRNKAAKLMREQQEDL